MIEVTKSYKINQKLIKVDDIVEFIKKDQPNAEFQRGIVTYVDQDKIKIVRRVNQQFSISAHAIGTGIYEIKKLNVTN